jgi:hypothetical protein
MSAEFGETQTVRLDDCGQFEIVTPDLDFAPQVQRVRAQQSVMTRLSDHLTRYELPGHELQHTALSDLRRMNLTIATLFPNLEGAARLANIDELFRFK